MGVSGGDLIPIALEGARATGGPLGDAIGSTLSNVWQGLLGDRVAAWRIKNAMAYNKPINRLAKERGLEINLEKIPESFAFSWFDKATQEDNPELRELFAQLLANAAEGNDEALKRRNVELLSKLAPADAHLLNIFAREYRKQVSGEGSYFWADTCSVDARLFHHPCKDDFKVKDQSAFDTLISLRIIEESVSFSLDRDIMVRIASVNHEYGIQSFSEYDRAVVESREYIVTPTGASLIKALALDAEGGEGGGDCDG